MTPEHRFRMVFALASSAASMGFGGCAPVESEGAGLAMETIGPALPAETARKPADCVADPTGRPRNEFRANGACLLTQACEKGACANQSVDCASVDSCDDPTCTQADRFSADALLVVDLAEGGRLWQRGFATNLNYPEAEAYCANLGLYNMEGWRLPDGAESGSIVYRAGGLQGCDAPKYCVPAIDQAAFPNTAADLYWTSQPYGEAMHFARSYCDGRVTPYKESDSAFHFVRCVHDPLP